MRQHMENALTIARWLEEDARIEKVLYPELESHPQHLIHKKQSSGMSGMISFYLRGGIEESRIFLSNLKVCFCVLFQFYGCLPVDWCP